MTGNTTTHAAQIFRLPDVGEGLTEAEIVAWHVAAGDTVAVNQVLCEIETAKSIVELPSPFEGTVATLLAAVGDTVPVGEAIIEVASLEAAAGAPATTQTAEVETPKLLVGYGATDPGASRRRRGAPPAGAKRPADAPTHQAATGAPQPSIGPNGEKPRAKPPVRGLAKQLGVDLSLVTPSGPNGTVSREDVQRAATAVAPSGSARILVDAAETHTSSSAAGMPTRIPIKGVRKATATAMVESAFTAPHVTEFVAVDITASLELLAQVQRRREFADVKLTPLSLVARAYLRAIERTPMAAAHWDDEAQEIVVPGTVNLGIAAATPRGLIVPNIKGASTLGLLELAQAIGELATTARAGKTPPADLADGDTTITNIGVFGIDAGTPILNPGETTILAIGAIQRRPWVVGTGDAERIEPRSIMQLALSFDHRVLDGAEGSRLLADTAEVLTNPGLALL